MCFDRRDPREAGVMLITDTHAHLDAPEFEADLDQVLRRAAEAGVGRILCVGTDLPSSRRCVELVGRHPGRILAAAGVHPNDWAQAGPDDWAQLEELARRPEVAAIGETGLDFHYTYTCREAQAEAMRLHVRLARRTGKPLIIHARNSDEEVLGLLREDGPTPGGVRHCFDRPLAAAEGYLALGYHVAVGAAATRPGYVKFKQAVRALPAERLLLETDCPYQSPAARAGDRNEPAFIVETLNAVAELRGQAPDALAKMTSRSAESLFGFGR
jgi:TatD DNase family protein